MHSSRVFRSPIAGLLIAIALWAIAVLIQYRQWLGVAHSAQSKPVNTAALPSKSTNMDMPARGGSDETAEQAVHRLEEKLHNLTEECRARKDELEMKNARLQADIARLEGKPWDNQAVALAEAKIYADKRRGLHPEADISPTEELDTMVHILDCEQAIIEKHNRQYPTDPWANIGDVQELMGGKPGVLPKAKAKACADSGGILMK